MKIRFQADADLNEDIVSGVLRLEPSIDFQTAVEDYRVWTRDVAVVVMKREK